MQRLLKFIEVGDYAAICEGIHDVGHGDRIAAAQFFLATTIENAEAPAAENDRGRCERIEAQVGD